MCNAPFESSNNQDDSNECVLGMTRPIQWLARSRLKSVMNLDAELKKSQMGKNGHIFKFPTEVMMTCVGPGWPRCGLTIMVARGQGHTLEREGQEGPGSEGL